MRIHTEDLEFSYGKKNILKDINFKVGGRKFVGIVGPNGCGKTTMLKLLYRVLKPYNGVVYLDNKDINRYNLKDTARNIAVVGQHNYYEFDFSVLEIVLMGRTPHKKMMESDNQEDIDFALNSLEKVGIIDFKNRNFNSLSGGEQQRVILARALTQNPTILILDEPTNHLDIKYQLELLDIVKSLKIEVIAALHDLNLASVYCDEIVALNNGEIFAQGTPKEVFNEQNIKELYDVNAKILNLENNQFQIVYNL